MILPELCWHGRYFGLRRNCKYAYKEGVIQGHFNVVNPLTIGTNSQQKPNEMHLLRNPDKSITFVPRVAAKSVCDFDQFLVTWARNSQKGKKSMTIRMSFPPRFPYTNFSYLEMGSVGDIRNKTLKSERTGCKYQLRYLLVWPWAGKRLRLTIFFSFLIYTSGITSQVRFPRNRY